MPNRLRISLVIPVYNEESHLADCLAAALNQDVPFHEIIVVDNNSTDATAAIARQFAGVKVLTEPTQGVVYARNRGLNVATGDVLGRIDADTRLPTDWMQQVQRIFEGTDTAAVSGSLHYYDVAANGALDAIDRYIRSWLSRKMQHRIFLLGANMVVRAAAWQQTQPDACTDSGLHEDLDLAIHLGEAGHIVRYDAGLLAGVSGRRADTNFISFVKYLRSLPATYERHGAAESRYMYPVIGLAVAFYLPLRLLYRCFDEETQAFRLSRLFTAQDPQRVNPASFVD